MTVNEKRTKLVEERIELQKELLTSIQNLEPLSNQKPIIKKLKDSMKLTKKLAGLAELLV